LAFRFTSYYFLLFHSNNGIMNAPQCYVLRTAAVLLNSYYMNFTTRVLRETPYTIRSPYNRYFLITILTLLLLLRLNSDRVLALSTILLFKAVLYLFCPVYKLHLLQIIPDIIFPSRLGPSSWSSCEWFSCVYSFYYDSFGHSIYVSYVYWILHHCNSRRIKDQHDVTSYFISLLMCSKCFGH